MSHVYEVEIKSLLGSKEKRDALISKLKEKDANIKLVAEEKQLNHYFIAPENVDLKAALSSLIAEDKKAALDKILTEGKKLSVRTRESNGKVIFVIKASVGDDTSSNGVKRIEFESPVSISLADLDNALIKAGLSYQAKWSREREEYASGDMHVCLDRNAGYGYVAEFEKMTQDEADLEKTRQELLSFMSAVGADELKQDRLERMFAHYNAHWSEYYGTEKTFTIE
nr:CYTH domain protein [uncultured bacterium]